MEAIAHGNVTLKGAVQAKNDISLRSEEGTITAEATVTSVAGKVEATAQSDITAVGAVQAKNDITLLSKGGAITTKDTLTSVAGSIDATANGNVTTEAALSARQGAISVTSNTARQHCGRRCGNFHERKRNGEGE